VPQSITARAPGKVNLALRVGGLGADGYHPVVTVYQAVNTYEQVTATSAPSGSGITIKIKSHDGYANLDTIPADHHNIAHQAAALVAGRAGFKPDVVLTITKAVPVAGGMAGGSADGAATLVACNELWGCRFDAAELRELGAELGSDVPFSLLGGTAIGTGRGHLLTPIPTRGEFHWAFGLSDRGLSTPEVYRKFDELKRSDMAELLLPTKELLKALASGDAATLGRCLSNDLQPAAFALRPELARTIDIALAANALGAVVSGSGPTVAALAESADQAQEIALAWQHAGVVGNTIVTTSATQGAQVVV